mmetsp:Transcript_24221/g.39436  ORF Transcript_24221/g.39436 Transcript_24221/m.39436 type:complete len:118 (-) Transcript_24221:1095-1448(-)
MEQCSDCHAAESGRRNDCALGNAASIADSNLCKDIHSLNERSMNMQHHLHFQGLNDMERHNWLVEARILPINRTNFVFEDCHIKSRSELTDPLDLSHVHCMRDIWLILQLASALRKK